MAAEDMAVLWVTAGDGPLGAMSSLSAPNTRGSALLADIADPRTSASMIAVSAKIVPTQGDVWDRCPRRSARNGA